MKQFYVEMTLLQVEELMGNSEEVVIKAINFGAAMSKGFAIQVEVKIEVISIELIAIIVYLMV